MQKNKISTKQLTMMAMLIALSIILTRICKIQIGNSIRIEFGNVPILLAGLFFGPGAGAVAGGAADILGANLFGTRFDIPFTLAAMAVGLIGGFFRSFVFTEKKVFFKTLTMTLTSNILVKMIFTTFLLHRLFGQPLLLLLSVRIPLYLFVALAEAFMIHKLIGVEALKQFVKAEKSEAKV
ncbi:MAG: folate family ECF transporter S component [Johnsonella sp.]|nr:folate family ECF transporter S component [Johnsonella sp.]